MAVDRAMELRSAEGPELEHLDTQNATDAGARFHANGPLPGVANDAPARPSASELAYGEDKPAYITGDIMYEQLAHRFAYRDKLTAEDHEWLTSQGLQCKGTTKGKHGLAMMAFVPLPGFDGMRRPVLAFRGTDDMRDVLDDFNANGVGAAQMAVNEGLIAKTLMGLQAYGKEPAVTGHSLGGALAQMAAARFPDLVAKVVTFQSPGIPREMAQRVDQANAEITSQGKGETVHSHHYQVNGDLVGKSGEALTSGEVSQISRPTGYLVRHTGYVTEYSEANPDKQTKIDAKDRKPGAVEGLRSNIGKFLRGLQEITNSGPSDYIEVWERVRDAVDRDASESELRTIIDKSKLSRADKQHMRTQLDDVVTASAYDGRDPEPDIRTAE